MKRAKYWQTLKNKWLECTLCPRHCKMDEGQRGLCLGRHRIGDELFAETYGLACGLAIDPIEKKPLRHFLPGTEVLSFGTTGCNLTCGFCQNVHLSRASVVEGNPLSPADIVHAAIDHQCASVAFTYNEPTVFFEYALDTAKACHKSGIKTVAVSNGWIEPDPRKELYAHIDAANIDLKAFTDRFYHELCGATLQPVLDTLLYLQNETRVHLEVTTLLIPGQNDSPAEIDAMTHWAVKHLGPDVPWHFSAYRPMPQWNLAPPTPLDTLLQAESIAKQNGLRYIHLGNIGATR